ncbi:MAG: histidine kinase [Paludibacteraceae bacterium]|nr:histidine kinase [Paludibacteraceae bacterium]
MNLKYITSQLRNYGVEAFVWLAVFLLLTISNVSYDLILSVELAAILTFGMFLISIICHYILIPYFYKDNRYVFFVLVSLLFIAGVSVLSSSVMDVVTSSYMESLIDENEQTLLDIKLPSETKPFFDEQPAEQEASHIHLSSLWKSIILYIGSFFLSLVMYYRKRTKDAEEQQSLLLQENVRMELNFLRSQINPHFLFNALNNIYSMVYTGDSHAADSVISLSEMLRYVTYESKESRILLSGEISYLDNYIEFQRFSFEGNVDVTFEKNIKSNAIYIAPMLFQPFVENSFKYSGIGQDKDAFIHITLEADQKDLSFQIINSKKKSIAENAKTGIGIENVRKRLELIYPNRYQLVFHDQGTTFQLNLHIQLDNK